MDVLDTKTDEELILAILAESAKSLNEIRCAQRDIDKATKRIQFLVMLANTLIDRKKG